MQVRVKILAPGKKGINRKIASAVESAGGKVHDLCISRKMKGMNEISFRMNVENEGLKQSAIQALGEIPGIALLEAADLPSA
jgi:hypothetical protein